MKKINHITIADDEAYLRQISKEVSLTDNELSNDISVLENYCKDNEVLAMAAIQLRIPKRLIYVKNTDLEIVKRSMIGSETEDDRNYNEARILINPVIIKKEGLTEYWETCASCLDNMGHVYRPYRIEVEYIDINGIKNKSTFEGFPATVLSHEIDHLNGVLHIDISDEVILMLPEERKKFRQTHGYNIIKTIGNYDKLKKSKIVEHKCIVKKVSNNHEDFLKLCSYLEEEHIRIVAEQRSPKGNCLNNLDKFSTVLIAYDNDNPIGCLALTNAQNKVVELGRLYVRQDYRKNGIATKLFSIAFELARQQNAKKIILDTYARFTSAVNLYKKLGFQEVANYLEYSKYSICMEKKLK